MTIESEQYLHKYRVQMGLPMNFYSGSIQLPTAKSDDKVSAYLDKPKEGVELTEHNMSFQIVKTKEASDSSITFYNLSDTTRLFIEQYQNKNPVLMLEAGYISDLQIPLLFQGEVIDVKDSFSGHTRTTQLTLKSGATNMKESYSVRSYRAGTSASAIVKDVIRDMRLPEGTMFFGDKNNVVIEKPVVVNGASIDWLRKFSKNNSLKFWIEDGVANILPDNYVELPSEFVHGISSSTNMIGSPTVANGDTATQERQPANKQTLSVTTTLNGAYKIGDKVALTSKYYNGVYVIETITHSGTFEGSDWQSTLQIKPLDGWEIPR